MRNFKLQIVFLLAIFFACALTKVQAHTLTGVVDKDGMDVIPCQFADIQNVAQRFFVVRKIADDKPGSFSEREILDYDGKPVEYTLPSGFILMDVIISPDDKDYQALPPRTRIVVRKADRYALIDKSGSFILNPEFSRISYRGDGMFQLEKKTDAGDEYFLFDSLTDQTYRFDGAKYDNSGNYENGKLFFSTRNGSGLFRKPSKCGYVGRKGEMIVEYPFQWVGKFVDGVAPAAVKPSAPSCIQIDQHNKIISQSNPTIAFINARNQVVSPLFDSAEPFQDKFSVARLGDRFGIINQKFQFITPKKYSSLQRAFSGAYVGNESGTTSWTAIDSGGKLLFKFPADVFLIDGMANGLIICRMKNKEGKLSDKNGQLTYGAFDSNGKLRWKAPLNGRIESNTGGLFVASRDGLQWVIDASGKQILAPQRDCFVSPVDANRFIKSQINDNFNQADWNAKGKGEGSRFDEFRRFLRDYNLIGMSKKQVSNLLGAPPRYSLQSDFCALANRGFELEFEGEYVKQWRMTPVGNDQNLWITTNMVFEGPNNDTLLPKSSLSTPRH